MNEAQLEEKLAYTLLENDKDLGTFPPLMGAIQTYMQDVHNRSPLDIISYQNLLSIRVSST